MRIAVLLLQLCCAAAAPKYEDVAKIFEERCFGCHSADVRMGSLSLETHAGLMQGGTTKVVVPGKSNESRLYMLISGKAMPSMPMDGTKLSGEEIKAIESWIDAGAPPPASNARIARVASLPKIAPKNRVEPQIFDLAYNPDGKLLALAGYREVRLIDTASKQPVATLTGHAGAIRALAFSPDGRLLAAAGGLPARSGEVLIWDVAQRKTVHIIRGHSDCIYGVAFSPDGNNIATASYDKLIKLWDVASEKEARTYKDHIDAVYAVAFTPDGKRLVSGSADRSVKIWNVETGERLYTFAEPQDGINTVAIDSTGKLVAAGGLDKNIRIWSLGESGGALLHSLIAHEDAILRLAWSPDGKELLSSSADKTVKLFRSDDLSELKSFAERDWAYGLQFSPDGKTYAIGRFDGQLTIAP